MKTRTLFYAGLTLCLVTLFSACATDSEIESAAAVSAAQDFYTDWNTPSNSTLTLQQRMAAHSDVVTEQFAGRIAALSQDGTVFDPIICGSGRPDSIDVVAVPSRASAGGTAQVTVSQRFGTRVVPVAVTLRQSASGTWRIDAINCPPSSSSSSNSAGSNSSTSTNNSSMNNSSRAASTSSMNNSSRAGVSSSMTNSSRAATTSSRMNSSAMNSSAMRSSTASMSASAAMSTSARAQAGLGQFCGGIAGIQCQSGLTCMYEGTYPDAGGTCISQ